MTTAVQSPTVQNDANAPIHGPRIFRWYLGEARHNWNFRHEATPEIQERYAPKTDPRDFWSPRANNINAESLLNLSTVQINKLSYNIDYDLKNEFTAAVIVEDIDDFTSSSPTTIIYSDVQRLGSNETSWRYFPSGNQHIQPRNRGPITNLQGYQNKDLIIHHRDSLFITQTNLTLSGDTTNVRLNSVDLFDIPPKEIVSNEEGYAGTQHPFSCKLTKVGYSFLDNSQGKIFLFNGSNLDEISAKGMRNFFRDNRLVPGPDNPFTASGYTMAYDEKYNRLLVSMKQAGESPREWTASYNPSFESWVSFHDYTPDYMFPLINQKLLSLKNDNQFFVHNKGVRSVYYDASIKPFLVDFVYNQQPELDKAFSVVQWESAVYDGSVQVYDKTLDYITVSSEDKCTGRREIIPIPNIVSFDKSNTRNINQSYKYNQLDDIALSTGFIKDFYNNFDLDLTKLNPNMPWYQRRKLIDKFIVYRLEYTNPSGYKFLLLNQSAGFELSYR
jgi:hypothetical protein